MHRFRRSLPTVLVATAGVATALGVASLTQAASGEHAATTTPTTTSTTKTSTTKTTTAPKPKAAAPKAVEKTITCKAKLYATRTPVSNAEEFGTVSCARPLGKGVQHNTAKVTRSADGTKGTFSGRVKLFLNTGTVRGSYKTQFTVQTAAAKYDGTMKISSGTGDFKGVTGTGTITGSSANAITSSLTEKLTLTFAAAGG